jgi:hypothetical protein
MHIATYTGLLSFGEWPISASTWGGGLSVFDPQCPV